MRLRWDLLLGSILFFGVFFFDPLLEAVGPTQTTLIICTGLVLFTLLKIVEYSTDTRCNCNQRTNEDEDKDEDEDDRG